MKIMAKIQISGTRHYAAHTTLEGLLNVIDVHGSLKISIHDESYDKDIRCVCRPDHLEKVRGLLNHRVTVTGEVRYSRKTDAPISITVEEIDAMPDESVGFGDMKRIDMGDKSSEGYIRGLRDGD